AKSLDFDHTYINLVLWFRRCAGADRRAAAHDITSPSGFWQVKESQMRLVAPILLLALPVTSAAQARYLGPGEYTQTYVTPRNHIAWQGDFTGVGQRRLNKSLARLDNLAAPEKAKSDLASYPAADVNEWIDAG